MKSDEPKPTYVLIPRKLVITMTISFICMVTMTTVSVQWASYVDRKSNQRWCGIVSLFNETYKVLPPPTPTGKQLAIEFVKLSQDFKCK